MQSNELKKRLDAGAAVIGSFVYVPSAKLTELIALSGFDFLVIDQEHGPISAETAEEMVRACQCGGCTPMVRVAHLHSHTILGALDSGAMGVHIPSINTVEDCRAAVEFCRYAPLGSRGLAGVRAAGYGLRGSLSDYCKKANEEVLVVAHIENIEAIHNLNQLLAVDGIDVYFLGPTDLSSSLNRPGSADPELRQLVDIALSTIVRAGKVAGVITTDTKAARQYIDLGVRYLATHALRFMHNGSQAFLNDVRT